MLAFRWLRGGIAAGDLPNHRIWMACQTQRAVVCRCGCKKWSRIYNLNSPNSTK